MVLIKWDYLSWSIFLTSPNNSHPTPNPNRRPRPCPTPRKILDPPLKLTHNDEIQECVSLTVNGSCVNKCFCFPPEKHLAVKKIQIDYWVERGEKILTKVTKYFTHFGKGIRRKRGLSLHILKIQLKCLFMFNKVPVDPAKCYKVTKCILVFLKERTNLNLSFYAGCRRKWCCHRIDGTRNLSTRSSNSWRSSKRPARWVYKLLDMPNYFQTCIMILC